jgi:hypothetical protein
VADVETGFPREVAETFLRCKRDGFDQTNAIIELNALKIAEDRTFADCARYIFTTILGRLQVLTLVQCCSPAAVVMSVKHHQLLSAGRFWQPNTTCSCRMGLRQCKGNPQLPLPHMQGCACLLRLGCGQSTGTSSPARRQTLPARCMSNASLPHCAPCSPDCG